MPHRDLATTHPISRRRLLGGSLAAPIASWSGRGFAAPAAGGTRLLVVFLRGAYDAASLLVPSGSSYYYESRPNIAIPRPGADPNAALALDADWSLHPALRESLWPMFHAGQLAFVPFAGTDDASRSHFETQDGIEAGQPTGRSRDYQSGFLNRLAAVLGGGAPIAFTDQLPLVFRGPQQVPNLSMRNLGKPSLDARQGGIIAGMYQGTPLGARVEESFGVRDEAARVTAEMEAAGRNAIGTRGFELEARRIGRLMRERYDLAFVDVGGWDTHVGQGGVAGPLATRLQELGRALAGIADELGPAWRDTVIVVGSEFGRTFRENGNRGTDHGHGSVWWLLGGAVRGGRIVGDQVKLAREALFQDRDYPVLTEYRAMLGGLFARMYGLDPARVERVFPGATVRDLGLA